MFSPTPETKSLNRMMVNAKTTNVSERLVLSV